MPTPVLMRWLWREILSVLVAGAVGTFALEGAWALLGIASMPPRGFLLFAGVVCCAALHPVLCPKRRAQVRAELARIRG